MEIHWLWLPLIITLFFGLISRIFEGEDYWGFFGLCTFFIGFISLIIYFFQFIYWLLDDIKITGL